MEFSKSISQIRANAKLTQAKFAELFGVSAQAVQKWENGTAIPDIEKIVRIAKHFDLSLDTLIMGNDNRIVEEQNKKEFLKPQYQNLHDWEFYAQRLGDEYEQSTDEGLDIEEYKDVFLSVSRLHKSEIKKKLGDVLFDVIISARQKADYPYVEPSDLAQIQAVRRGTDALIPYDKATLKKKIHGAWLGRVCGCMLGKSIEGVRTNELVPFLKETDNYPMHRYIYRSDLEKADLEKYKFAFAAKTYADEITEMPPDDDTNYTVLAQKIIEKYGKDFTPYDVSRMWLSSQSKDAYCTAERVAFCNFVNGYEPPQSALYKNPFREWIGAQIRADYFGYINPGNPKLAAEMAWRDASISHVKNGIYGEMFVAAMLSIAATTNDLEKIIEGGLAEIPDTSRLYNDVNLIIDAYKNGASPSDAFKMIHDKYNEYTNYGWCHTISNAMIVTAALLFGGGDYGKSICMAVETGFDTDCNGATVGSILGMANGVSSIPECWSAPINNRIRTTIFGVGTVNITDCVDKTMSHIIN